MPKNSSFEYFDTIFVYFERQVRPARAKITNMKHRFTVTVHLVSFRNETGHQTVGDGGTYPDFRQHIVGVIAEGLHVDVVVIECGNEHIDDADDPQVALGVALPVLASIEIGERTEQKYREDETHQMECEKLVLSVFRFFKHRLFWQF